MIRTQASFIKLRMLLTVFSFLSNFFSISCKNIKLCFYYDTILFKGGVPTSPSGTPPCAFLLYWDKEEIMGQIFFIQQPQPQLLFEYVFSQPQTQPFPFEKRVSPKQERTRRRIIHEQLFPPKRLLQAIV